MHGKTIQSVLQCEHTVSCWTLNLAMQCYSILGKGDESDIEVVSSSGAMANHTHGQEIDNHDIVIRFNDAVTEGYQKQAWGVMRARLV